MLSMSSPRKAIFNIAPRGGDVSWQVELVVDDYFIERLQQLRRLVKPVTPLMAGTNLIIDKVRARLPSAIWHPSNGLDREVVGSSLVVSSDGTCSCTAKHIASRVRLHSVPVAIDDLEALHKSRPEDEVIYVSQGTIDARSDQAPGPTRELAEGGN